VIAERHGETNGILGNTLRASILSNNGRRPTPGPRLLLAGVADADGPTLHRLMRAGQLPHLTRLIETGVSRPLRAPVLAGPAPWATIATGQPAMAHGVVSDWAVRPDGGGIARTGAGSWRAAPVWAVLQSAGIPCATIGWPATRAATAWPGLVVDDSFTEPTPSVLTDWPLPPACISPARLRPALRGLRVHPGELDAATRGALPALALAAAASVHAAATYVMEHEAWHFLAVHYTLLVAHGGDEVYAVLDAMVGRLVSLAGPETDVIVVSPVGLLVASGQGFAANATVHGAALQDIMPTVLARFGLRSEELPGRMLDATRHGELQPVAIPKLPAPAAFQACPPPGPTAAKLIAGVESRTAPSTWRLADL